MSGAGGAIPTDEDALAQVVASASGPLRIEGGGTRIVARGGMRLPTSGLDGIRLYEPGALTLVAGAGTPLAEVEALLAAERQRLAFEPMDHRGVLGRSGEPTIGGVVAANVSGPRRIQTGACRDHVLGLRFVDGRGVVLKSGGRVMKNVTGYDLVRLLAGSHGTLGVITEVSLKVQPAPEAAATLIIGGLTDAQAIAALARALGSPWEVSGAAHAPRGRGGKPETMIRIEGFSDMVADRAKKLRGLLAGFGDCIIESDPEKIAARWKWVRDVQVFHHTPGDVWRLSVKSGEAPELAARLGAGRLLYDWGGGLIWAEVEAGTDLRARMTGVRGHATLVRASDETRARIAAFQPQPAPLAALSAALRAQFDPRGILNPGLMG